MARTRYRVAALALAGVVVAGCSSGSGTDGGVDGPVTQADAKADTSKPADSGSKDSTTDSSTAKDSSSGLDGSSGKDSSMGNDAASSDASDAGTCDFNAFVINLFKTATTATALPSTNLGQSCADTHTLIDTTQL